MSVVDVFGVHAPFLQIVYRCAIVYAVLVVGMRLTGTRQLGQMTVFDLVLILLIANAVQNAMVGSDASILGGVVAAASLLVMNRFVGAVADRVPWIRREVEGQTVLLLHDGELLEDHIRHAGLSDDLVLQSIREHGFEHASDVRMAVLEVDGTISIVPLDAQIMRTRRRVRAIHPGS